MRRVLINGTRISLENDLFAGKSLADLLNDWILDALIATHSEAADKQRHFESIGNLS